jgi:hypothetical protein
MRHLQKLYATYKDKGLVVLGFDAMDDKKLALEMLRDNGATFPNILDASDAARKVCYQEYQRPGMNGVPLSYIIDRDGKVVDAWYGGEEKHSDAIAVLRKTGGPLGDSIQQEWNDGAAKAAPEVAAAARRLFEALRAADYDHDWTAGDDWKRFPAQDFRYEGNHDSPGWVRWACKKFKTNPIVDVRFGEVFASLNGSPAIPYELQLKDGEILRGDLPFRRDSRDKQWIGLQGLDWHLQKSP